MAPNLNNYNPKEKEVWQAAYAEGYQAGKRYALRELKYAIKNIEKLEPFTTFTSTSNLLNK